MVIKAVEPTFTPQGKRHIFKVKNAKFEEVNPKVPLTKYEQKREAEKSRIAQIYDEIERYITDNRMDTLRSKIGEVTRDRTTEVVDFYLADVMKDFIKDEEELWNGVEDEEEKERITKNTRSKVNSFVQQWMLRNNI